MYKKYHYLDELDKYMSEKYNAKKYANIKEAKNKCPKLFEYEDFGDVADYTVNVISNIDKYFCYVIRLESVYMCIVASVYDDGVIKNIYIPDYASQELNDEEIFSFLPFSKEIQEENAIKFSQFIAKYKNNYCEENVEDLFTSLFHARIVVDESEIKNEPFYVSMQESDKMLREIGLEPLKLDQSQIYCLQGEDLYIPKQETGCYVIVNFSNHKVVSVVCGYSRFKYRYLLDQLIDIDECARILD